MGILAIRGLRSGEPRYAVARDGVGILEAELHVFEPSLDQLFQPRSIEMNAGGDQVAVKSDFIGMADELGEVAANERLAAREMHLQHAQSRRLREDTFPGIGVEFGAGARQFERVRAIGATQRTSMRQLGQQRQRRVSLCHVRSTFLSTRSCSILTTSLAMTSRGAS